MMEDSSVCFYTFSFLFIYGAYVACHVLNTVYSRPNTEMMPFTIDDRHICETYRIHQSFILGLIGVRAFVERH